jgi:hypothetical protein
MQLIVLSRRVDIEVTEEESVGSQGSREWWSRIRTYSEKLSWGNIRLAQSTATVAFRAGLNACQAQQAHFDSRAKGKARKNKWERLQAKLHAPKISASSGSRGPAWAIKARAGELGGQEQESRGGEGCNECTGREQGRHNLGQPVRMTTAASY